MVVGEHAVARHLDEFVVREVDFGVAGPVVEFDASDRLAGGSAASDEQVGPGAVVDVVGGLLGVGGLEGCGFSS